MSTPSITGRQARELLDDTTPGPWEVQYRDNDPEFCTEQIGPMGAEFPVGATFWDGPLLTGRPEDHRLMAAAPELAETVCWLYTPDGPPDGHDVNARAGTVWLDGIDHTPDEAVNLARALLAAAEDARDGVDR